ncbi:MAG: hypothetical protein JKY17_08155 [Magnetovibrio sp.]|nr:hypothetical protein [Magnetovibrio sp.]
MAESLEQAVETVEPDSGAQSLPLGGEGASAVTPGTQIPSTPAASEPDPDAAVEDPSTAPAILNDRYLIFPEMPLPEFNSPTALAYGVDDRSEPNRVLFALVCEPNLPVQREKMIQIRGSTVGGLIPLIDFGPVFWAPFERKCVAIIYERPRGGRFIDSFGKAPVHMSEYEIGSGFVEQIMPTLNRFSTLGIAHRSIRLDNLYFMDQEHEHLVLGDCVSAPPGYNQPKIYESAERAITMPTGRGVGSSVDDVYALGITLVFLLLGKNPAAKLSEADMLRAKCDQGTYKFLCSKERLPLPLIEIVRGVLADDPEERWSVEAVARWMQGHKPHATQHKSIIKSKSPYNFKGKDYYTSRIIAHAFSENIPDAIKAIKDSKLEVWLRKSLNAPNIADEITTLLMLAKVHESKPEGSNDVLVSKVCIRLDPTGPIRYKGFSFMIDGFSHAFATEYLRKTSFQIQGEILARDLVSYWGEAQAPQNGTVVTQVKPFRTLRSFAQISALGYGMERCLYELNRSMPCQGELLKEEYVDNIDALLPALDDISGKVDQTTRPMDKHMVAFITTHFNHEIQPHIKALSNPKEETSMIGLLSLLALIQWKQAHINLFGLSNWVGGLLHPAIQTYHSRTTQRTIEQEIPSLVRQGSLPDLFDLVDNAQRRHSDALAFQQAQINFSGAEAEIQSIVGDDIDQEQVALESGEKSTAMFAVLAGMIATTITIFIMMM